MISDRPFRIGLAAYPCAQQSAVLGLQELLQEADRFQQTCTAGAPPFDIEIIDDFSIRNKMYDAIVLPPSLNTRPEGEVLVAIAAWVLQQHTGGALTCSVCAGVFPLAASGLLDGRQATTHWTLAQEFSHTYPKVVLEADRLLIDDGDVITAGGLMAWTDLGLRLVARFMGLAVMLETARFFLIDPGRREQSYYNLFSPNLCHGDAAVLKAQHWVQGHYQRTITVPQMAAVAGLEERTFLRRFHMATQLKPSEYLQHVRITKARQQLELTSVSIETVAMDSGYFDISAFRKVFQRIVGLSPSEYRKRFTPPHA